ncbi:MAG TPA: response regulator transcription factor [Candidatus Dormibacteraeota bacterium]|nr:response regulator transcription factor [Candidatus Dormibacteraeota bacterium]
MRLLIAEDDAALGMFLQRGLVAEHYVVDLVADGEDADRLAKKHDYDLLILDLTLPRLDGLEVLKHVRANNGDVPIIVLTGRGQVEDRVRTLDLGADDYVTKPFEFSELSARIRALLRRGIRSGDTVLRVGDLVMDRASRTVRRGSQLIELTPKEFSLLEYLMRNQGHQVTRAMIVEHVWNLSFDTMTNVVDVYINYLRKKIDIDVGHKMIQTVRGVGYQLGASNGASA